MWMIWAGRMVSMCNHFVTVSKEDGIYCLGCDEKIAAISQQPTPAATALYAEWQDYRNRRETDNEPWLTWDEWLARNVVSLRQQKAEVEAVSTQRLEAQ